MFNIICKPKSKCEYDISFLGSQIWICLNNENQKVFFFKNTHLNYVNRIFWYILSGNILTKVTIIANIASALTVACDTVILDRALASMLACIGSLAGIHQLAVI
jgi:hypothetical protein